MEGAAIRYMMRRRARRYLHIVAALSVALGVAALVLGRAYYLRQLDVVRERSEQELTAIATLKVGEIARWRSGLVADVRHLGADELAAARAAEWARTGDAAAAATILAWLRENVEAGGHDRIMLVDATGERWLSTDGTPPNEHDITAAKDAIQRGTAQLSDAYAGATTGSVHLDASTPLKDERGAAQPVALIIRQDASRFLFPLVQTWPVPSETGETLLVRRDGDALVYLNDLRFRKRAALTVRLPLTRTEVIAVRAVLGERGVMSGSDYRGRRVIGAAVPVPDSDWILVAKMDEAEAFAGATTAAREAGAGVALFILALASGLVAAWRTQLAATYRAQAELAEKYESLSRYANDAVYLADADLRIIEVNDAMCRMYGYTREELLGMGAADLHDGETRDETPRNATRVRDAGGSLILETRHVRKDGTPMAVELSARAIGQPGEERYITVARDVTARKAAEAELAEYREHLEAVVEDRTAEVTSLNEELTSVNEELTSVNEELASANDELQRTNEQLRAATTAKSEFLANMSHELRTPLNSIIGFAGVMLQGMTGDLTGEQREQLTMIRRSGDRLLALINDILDLSRVESGRTSVKASPVELADAVAAAIETARPLAAQKGLELVAGPVPAGVSMRTDEQKLHQILVNLLSNAVKFTDAGCVSLQVTESGPATVVIEVSDNGVGIAPEDLDEIFEEFVQVSRHGAKPEGTGLGLAISRRLAEMLGGSLTAVSEPGVGSTFTLVVPRRYRTRG